MALPVHAVPSQVSAIQSTAWTRVCGVLPVFPRRAADGQRAGEEAV